MCANLGTCAPVGGTCAQISARRGTRCATARHKTPQMCEIAPQILAIIQHNLRQNLCWLIRFLAFSVAWQRLRVTHMHCFGLGFRSSSTQIAIAQYVAKAKIYHESSMKPLLHRHCPCYENRQADHRDSHDKQCYHLIAVVIIVVVPIVMLVLLAALVVFVVLNPSSCRYTMIDDGDEQGNLNRALQLVDSRRISPGP